MNVQTANPVNLKTKGSFNEPLFSAKSVLDWLGLENSLPAVSSLTDATHTSFLTEDQLYEVLMRSDGEVADAFRTQVKTILKSIRKHGSFPFHSGICDVNPDTLTANLNVESDLKNNKIYKFFMCFQHRFVWDFVPTEFLYDLYESWCKSDSAYSGQILGYNRFKAGLEHILAELYGKVPWKMTVNAVRTTNKLTKLEPLITEYNLIRWREPVKLERLRGIIRLTNK